MKPAVYRTRRWTRKEYGRLIDAGLLGEDDPIELVEGRLVVQEPQHTRHATATDLAAEAMRAVFGGGWRIRVGLPLALGNDSEPEPDVAVIRGNARDFLADHPATADLLVEIADSSVRFDRGPKARLYARAGIADYWIVNLVDRVVEVHRDPVREGQRHAAYAVRRVAGPGETITPLAAPGARVAVDDLLP
jgi:Uma2 family endonuclease